MPQASKTKGFVLISFKCRSTPYHLLSGKNDIADLRGQLDICIFWHLFMVKYYDFLKNGCHKNR